VAFPHASSTASQAMPSQSPPAACRTWIERLQQEASKNPSRCAFTFLAQGEDESGHLSYGELDERARAIAVALGDRIRPGSRVLLLHRSGLEFIAALFGCLYAGLIAVPALAPRARRRSTDRLQSIVADACPALVLTESATLARLRHDFEASPLAHLDIEATDTIDPRVPDRWREPPIDGDTVAILQYTSGSTARPRGVVLTHRAILHNAEATRQAFESAGDYIHVGWLPLHHDMGLIGNVLGSLYVGGRTVLMPPEAFLMKPDRWLRAMSRYRARSSGAPNFAYELCLERVSAAQRATLDLRHWQVAFCGAEPVRARTLQRFAEAFAPCGFRREAFYPCYGLAEATLLVTGGRAGEPPVIRPFSARALQEGRALPVTNLDADARELVGCGKTWNDQTLAIVDPATRKVCAAGAVGEICVRGGSVASGYWQKADATKETFGLMLADTGEGPFLRTGDLGFVHDGALYVSGRIKDLMIVAGRNHFAEDVEATVEQAHDAICPHGVAAFTVDADTGERPVVVVEIDRRYLLAMCGDTEAATTARDAITRAIRAVAAERHDLALPFICYVRPAALPRTSSGKLQRHAARAAYLANALPAIDEASPSPPDRTLADVER